MAHPADHAQLASHARRLYVDLLLKGLPATISSVNAGVRNLLDKPAEHATAQRRRDLVQNLMKQAGNWHSGIASGLRHVLVHGVTASMPGDVPARNDVFSLVDNDTIEREILTSRLALAVMDRVSWEFTDLRSRVAMLERRGELDTHDMLRAHILARVVLDAWRTSGLTTTDWREAQPVLHEEFASLAEEAYHETNRWLVTQKVMPDVDLRPFIRRTRDGAPASQHGGLGGQVGGHTGGHIGGQLGGHASGHGPSGFGLSGPGHSGPAAFSAGLGSGSGQARSNGGLAAPSLPGLGSGGHSPSGFGRPSGYGQDGFSHSQSGSVGEETRMMTRAAPLARGSEHAEAVLGRLNRLVARHLPGFMDTTYARPVTDALSVAINQTQQNIRRRFPAGAPPAVAGGPVVATRQGGSPATRHAGTVPQAMPTGPMLLDELNKNKQTLKQAATTQAERATIEIVAMMFQSILTEDRIPAALRVWFARLQMPVLRVAIGEPDFFATLDHPARRLIDRMGACVMGLDSAGRAVGDALEKEIKRVVQVVEAYPDTGRRVFQTVLVEFERFLEHYFKNENEASKRGVSLAQQVEQRETLAIQYTIELRRMLNEVPVQEGVRQFLFQVWADVLATSAVRFGPNTEETKQMKRAAADLIWSASAKVTREERAEVIRRLPPLLKRLREGMTSANITGERQDERIHALNSALAAAFTAKAAAIPNDRLQDLMQQLESLEELLPGAEEIEIDESLVLDLSGHESSELEVVTEGGSMPTPPMVAWARELLVGSWYTLEYRGRHESVQLSWQGMRRQLSLFVAPGGRCVLFQQQRLAAFLQAGLLVPAQDESLTVKATRNALAKLDADPSRLLT